MNKKVSKTLAAVLSAAMAASAFAVSTGAAFAAPNISISVDPLEVSLTEKTTSYDVDNTATATAIVGAITAELDGQNVTVSNPQQDSGWTSSNTNLAEITSDGQVKVHGENITSRQEVTFSSRYTVDLAYENGAHGANASTTATVTVSVRAAIYPEEEYVILPRLNNDKDTRVSGEQMIPDTNQTISINEETYYDIYQVRAAEGKGVAEFNRLNSDGTDPGSKSYADALQDVKVSADTSKVTLGTSGIKSIQINPQDPANVQTGNVIISATAKDAKGNDVNIQSASVTIDDTYLFEADDSVTVDASYGQDTKTLIADDDNVRGSDPKYDVTGMDVIVDNGASLTINDDDAGAELGNITDAAGETGSVNVYSGTVGDIDVDGTVTIGGQATNGATTGNVTAGGNVTITGSNKAEGPAVTVGDVTGDANVYVTAFDTTSNGQVVGGGDVTVGDIAGAGFVDLTAGDAINTMSLGSVSGVEGTYPDCPYTAKLHVISGTFDLGDLLYFGRIEINKEANVTAGAIDTGAAGATHSKRQNFTKSESRLIVNGRLTVDSIKTNVVGKGDGVIIAPVDSVEVTGDQDASGTTLLVKDARVGDVLYSSTVSNNNVFLMPGVTAVESTTAGQNVYTYTVDSLALRGVLMEQTGTVEVGTAGTTLSVMKMPFMAEMPEGVTVEWSANRDSVTLTPSADGLSCQVAATGYTADNIGDSNNVTVTAALYKDGEPWSDVTTSYASTSVNLSLTNAAPVAEPFTVKVTDLNGHTTTCAPDGSTVIEVPQSTSFRVEMTSGTSFPESQLDYHAANGDVAGTNTISAWNGTSGVYEVYAAGGVGEQASMWANGQRIFQIRVTSRPFTSDTTMDFDLKVGNTYTFAINPNNKNASFTFNTANGDALQTSIVRGAYPDANGIYYCKVKATQAAGKIGVYCTLDGVLYKVFTVNTIA